MKNDSEILLNISSALAFILPINNSVFLATFSIFARGLPTTILENSLKLEMNLNPTEATAECFSCEKLSNLPLAILEKVGYQLLQEKLYHVAT